MLLIKIAIIGVILLAGGFIFSSEINALFPTTTGTMTENVKNDVSNLGAVALMSVEDKVTQSTNNIESSVTSALDSSKESINSNIIESNPLQDFQDYIKTNIIEKFSN